MARSMMRVLVLGAAAVALGAGVASAQTKPRDLKSGCCAPGAKKAKAKPRPPRVEKLSCKLGDEDNHARIAVELHDGKVERFAYYSKWKPRTCSMEVERDDAYSKWEDTGNITVVTLIEDKGAFLIDHERSRFKFIFREIDRMRYCGMEGKVSGSLTIFRGRSQCLLEGVMERGEDAMVDAETPSAPSAASASAGEPAK